MLFDGFIGGVFSGNIVTEINLLFDIIRHIINNPAQVLHLRFFSFILSEIAAIIIFTVLLSLAYLLFIYFGRGFRPKVTHNIIRIDNKVTAANAKADGFKFAFIKKNTKMTA